MPRTSTCSVLGHQLDPIAEKNCAAPELYKCEEKMIFTRKQGGSNIIPPIRDHCHPHISWKAKKKILTPKKLPPSVPRSLSEPFERPAGASKRWSLRRRLSTSRSFPANNQTKTGKLLPPERETCSYIFLIVLSVQTHRDNNRQSWPTRNWNLQQIFLLIPCSWFFYAMKQQTCGFDSKMRPGDMIFHQTKQQWQWQKRKQKGHFLSTCLSTLAKRMFSSLLFFLGHPIENHPQPFIALSANITWVTIKVFGMI